MRQLKTLAMAAGLALTWSASASAAPIIYSNGAINGGLSAWQLDAFTGFTVINSFTVSSPDTFGSVVFGLHTLPGVAISTIDYFVTADTGNNPVTTPNPNIVSGTAPVSSSFLFSIMGFDVNTASFDVTPTPLAAGNYWFGLRNGTSTGGPGVFWDINNGPSVAFHSAIGNLNGIPNVGTNSSSFQLLATPEIDPLGASIPLTFVALGLLVLSEGRNRARVRA